MEQDPAKLRKEISELRDQLLIAHLKQKKLKRDGDIAGIIIPEYKEAVPHLSHPLVSPDAAAKTTSVSYTPIQLQTAYGLNQISTPGGSLRGTGIKVAVIIAYHYPNLQTDFNTFCQTFGLPQSTLQIINQAGTSTNAGWALECCLDVQMIKTAAPGASIMVIEAASASTAALNTAIATAVSNGANIVSMSWGSAEYSTQSTLETVFSNDLVCYVASSGDSSSQNCVPASLANVLSVGGTSLYLDGSNQRTNETVWGSAGGGVSQFTQKPVYQANYNTSFTTRCNPDICSVADPYTGVQIVYAGKIVIVGGTSASAPFLSGFLAVVNQLRVANSKTKLTTYKSTAKGNLLQNMLYNQIFSNEQNYKNCMYDVTSGIDGILQGAVGTDIISGGGSMIGQVLANYLATA